MMRRMLRDKIRAIHTMGRLKQIMRFLGLEWGNKGFTDLDGATEHDDIYLLLTEIKGIGRDPQLGQDILIRRLLNAWEEPNGWAESMGEVLKMINEGRIDEELLAKVQAKVDKHKDRKALGVFLTHNTKQEDIVDVEKCNVVKLYHPKNREWIPSNTNDKFGVFYKRQMGEIWKIPK